MFVVLVSLTALLSLSAAFECDFVHGVASGDPLVGADGGSVVLWTRATPRDETRAQPLEVSWEVRIGDADGAVVAAGSTEAIAEADWTVKVEAASLPLPESRTDVFVYRFTSGAAASTLGQFRLPAAPGEPQNEAKVAVFSCANYGWGHFGAYAAAATQNLDLALHLGDYYYEYGEDHYPSPSEAVRFGGLDPPHEAITLEDYRRRHAFYRLDHHLQKLTSTVPLLAVWDDHEISNNPWVGGAQDHQPETEGDWDVRKAAAIRAYHEWMPTRTPEFPFKAYRSFQLGNLATILLMETRLVNRTDPNEIPYVMDTAEGMVGDHDPSTWAEQGVEDDVVQWKESLDAYRALPNKTLLGGEQVAWLKSTTQQSVAAGTTWQLFGQQIVVQDTYGPDLEAAIAADGTTAAQKATWESLLHNLTSSEALDATFLESSPTPFRAMKLGTRSPVDAAVRAKARAILAVGRYRVNSNFDSWTGYLHEREKFKSEVLAEAANPVVYAGDSHQAWAGTLDLDDGKTAAEFDGTSVTSPGVEMGYGFLPPAFMEAGFVAANPNLAYSGIHHGYFLVHLTHDRHHTEFHSVPVSEPTTQSSCVAAFDVLPSPVRLERGRCLYAVMEDPESDEETTEGGGGAATVTLYRRPRQRGVIATLATLLVIALIALSIISFAHFRHNEEARRFLLCCCGEEAARTWSPMKDQHSRMGLAGVPEGDEEGHSPGGVQLSEQASPTSPTPLTREFRGRPHSVEV
mmetsp:Transcript_12947/g.42693  ORF Transcript_12947/g.42693 Transcript_12947/m.42693 type:complete len:743 (-) Transcript_12947:123-2351(-)